MRLRQPIARSGPRPGNGSAAVALAIMFALVFTVGLVIGYNSIYRNISVAMAPTPAGQL